jgi:hypothetical protein
MTKKKRKAPAGNEDFPVKKQKLGKRKLKPTTYTNISFKSKTIQLTTQNLRSNDVISSSVAVIPVSNDETGQQNLTQATAKDFVTKRNLSLNDITNQFNHYNVKIQATALKSMLELVTLHTHVLHQNLRTIIHATCPFITHEETAVRKELKKLLKHIFAQVSEGEMRPFVSFYVTYIGNALTNMSSLIRNYGLKILMMLLDHYEFQCAQYAANILPNLYNVFQMRVAGISYKGKNHKIGQELSASILDRYLGILLEYNKLKIPNYWKDDDGSLYFHHSHTQKQFEKDDILMQKKEFIFENGEILFTINNCFNHVEDSKMKVFRRLIQRRIADKSKIILAANTKDPPQKLQAKEVGSNDGNTSKKTEEYEKHHVLMLSEDVSNYSLETEKSLLLLINKFSAPLVELYLEFLTPAQPLILHNVLHSLYQLLYALEDLYPGAIEPDKMRQDFPFFKHLRRKNDIDVHFAKSTQLSCRIAWLGIMSFFDIEETIAQLLNIFCKNKFNGESKELGILLGAFWRISKHLSSEIELALWKGLTNIFLNEKQLSDNQKLVLLFFSDTVLKHKVLSPPKIIFETWAKHLPIMLCNIETQHMDDAPFLISTLSAFSKSTYQSYLTAESLFPLFEPSFFIELPSKYQKPLLYLLFHSSEIEIPIQLLKNMSQICSSEKCETNVASILIEFVALQTQFTSADRSTFLLRTLCGRPELIDVIVMAFSYIEDCLDRISGFMCAMLPKETIPLNVKAAQFTLLYHALARNMKRSLSPQNTYSKAVSSLMDGILPQHLLQFFRQCFLNAYESKNKYFSLVVSICDTNENLMSQVLKQLLVLEEPVALDMSLTMLRLSSNASTRKHELAWQSIYNHLKSMVSEKWNNNSQLNEILQQIYSQLILHQLLQ